MVVMLPAVFLAGWFSQVARGPQSAFDRSLAPTVLKVEPPNWWTEHTLNPVRVVIRGRHLTGARVTASGNAIRPGRTLVNDAGTYLFVDLSIRPGAAAGPYPLILTTSAGRTSAAFELRAPLPRAGRFQGFSPDDVIYLLMPDRFANGDLSNDAPSQAPGVFDRRKSRFYHGGDLQGIIDHLPYLKDLGVTAIWLNPIYDNVNHPNERQAVGGEPISDYHGYGAVDFYAVDEHFGDVGKLRELVEAAHAHGIKIVQDQVANHTGPYHPWVEDPPTPGWFNGTRDRHLENTWQTHLLMDPYAPAEMRRPTLEGWFVNILPDLNQQDDDVARYVIQNSLWWIGITGIDGIRQDTLPYVPRSFWQAWTRALKREYPNLTIVGEVLDGSPALVSFFQAGRRGFDGIDTGIDTLFDYPLFYALRRVFARGESMRQVTSILHQDSLYPAPDRLMTLIGSHDVKRFMSEEGATPDGLKLAATILLTARGIPQWYYGDEIAMPGGDDPDNRRDFPGGWPDDPRNAFAPEGRTPLEQAVFDRVRTLMRLRSALEPLRRGSMVYLALGDQTLVFARVVDRNSAIVAINNSKTGVKVSCPVTAAGLKDGTRLTDRLATGAAVRVEQGAIQIQLPPRSAAIYVASDTTATVR